MGKISDYTRVLAAKLADVFVVDQTDNGTTETKSATVEQIGTAIGTLQNFADLDTSNKTLVDSINEIAAYTPVYGNTASSAIATFDTSLALPLQDLQIAINGTDLTGANITVAGSNLWNEITEEGYINSAGNPTANVNSLRSKNFLPCTPNTAYYCYIPEDVIGGLAVCWYDINQTFISRDNQTHNVTSPANAFYFRLSLYNYKGTYPSYANNVSLNYPATDTTYHAYNANSTTTAISWNDLGTVSEGTLDVTTGKLTVVNGSMGAGVYQITPIPINQLSGTNNVFTDTNGDTSVVYACSLKDYIDRQ